jgi:capsular polysaccharide transport system permease protein
MTGTFARTRGATPHSGSLRPRRTKPRYAFADALRLQGRVVWALALREIRGKHGKYRIGYLWEIIKTGFGIAVFWGIREIVSPPSFRVLPLPLFLLLGFVVWFIFRGTAAMTVEAVITNKALLTFPQITPLDLYCSSAVVMWVTEIVTMCLYLGLFHALGYTVHLYDPATLGAALTGVFFFALGVGLILGAFATYLPVLEKIVPMVLRVMFFTSGIFFSPMQMSGRFGNFLLWNPVMNYIEAARSAFMHTKVHSIVKTDYVAAVTVSVFAFGLLLERHVRGRRESV